MQNVKFIKYEPTPQEKYMGIISCQYLEKIVLRYKVVMKKDGGGYFMAPASYKVGEDTYISAFVIDSRAEEEEIMNELRDHLRSVLSNAPVHDDMPF